MGFLGVKKDLAKGKLECERFRRVDLCFLGGYYCFHYFIVYYTLFPLLQRFLGSTSAVKNLATKKLYGKFEAQQSLATSTGVATLT